MTFKNGIKEYVFMGVFFGVIYSLITSLSKMLMGEDVELSYFLILVLLTGTLFASLMAFILSISNRKFTALRSVIAQGKQIICDGPCTYRGKNGWLMLTGESLEFYILSANNLTSGIYVFVRDIQSIKAAFNHLSIRTSKGEKFLFVVNKATKWKKLICSNIGK